MSHDMQQALAQSRAEFTDDRHKVGDLVTAGRFVVVLIAPAFCPRTDAVMGSAHFALSDHATREAAELALSAIDPEDYTEESLEVFPRLPFAPLLEVDLYAEDIPF